MENENRRGRGRPKEPITREHFVAVRLDDTECDRLQQISSATGDNMSDILRIALRGYYFHLMEVGKIEG